MDRALENAKEWVENLEKILDRETAGRIQACLKNLDESLKERLLETGRKIQEWNLGHAQPYYEALIEIYEAWGEKGLAIWRDCVAVMGRMGGEIALWFIRSSVSALAILGGADLLRPWFYCGWKLARHDKDAALWYFRYSPQILERLPAGDKKELFERCSSLVEVMGAESLEFLKTCPLVAKIAGAWVGQWSKVGLEMAGVAPKLAVAYFRASPAFFEFSENKVSLDRWARWGQLLAEKSVNTAVAYFSVGPQVLKHFSEKEELGIWVNSALRVAEISVEAAENFLLASPTLLSKADARAVARWVEYGLSLVKEERGCREKVSAFFSLKTKESQDAFRRFGVGVELEAVLSVLKGFAEAMLGKEVFIRSFTELPERVHGRRKLFSTSDGRRVYLPPSINVYDDEESCLRLYRSKLVHELGHLEFRSYDFGPQEILEVLSEIEPTIHFPGQASEFPDYFLAFSNPPLLKSIFELVEDGRVDLLLARSFPGLAHDFQFCLKTIPVPAGAGTEGLPPAEDLVRRLLLTLLGLSLEAFLPPGHPLLQEGGEGFLSVKRIYREFILQNRNPTVNHSLRAAAQIYLELEKIAGDLGGGSFFSPVNAVYRGDLRLDLVYVQQLLRETPAFQSLKLFRTGVWGPRSSLLPFLRVLRISEGKGGESPSREERRYYEQLREALASFAAEEQESGYRTVAYYDEWDNAIRDYKTGWCCVREYVVSRGTTSFVEKALRDYYGIVYTLKRYFSLLRPDRFRRLRRQEEGDQLDLDVLVEVMVEKRAGCGPPSGFYMRRDKRARDVAVAFLLDVSESTDQPVNEAGDTILDVERAAVVIMAQALEEIGDRYGIFGFSSDGRMKVNFYVVKDLEEPYSRVVEERLGSLRSTGCTRLGAAIRHAARKLQKIEAAVRLILILTDGRPYDFDYYSKEKSEVNEWYPIDDSRIALWEAKSQGLVPFCVTVDRRAKDYIEYLFGNVGYIVINDVASLPEKLPLIYNKLTR